jgi:hypothetical protein
VRPTAAMRLRLCDWLQFAAAGSATSTGSRRSGHGSPFPRRQDRQRASPRRQSFQSVGVLFSGRSEPAWIDPSGSANGSSRSFTAGDQCLTTRSADNLARPDNLAMHFRCAIWENLGRLAAVAIGFGYSHTPDHPAQVPGRVTLFAGRRASPGPSSPRTCANPRPGPERPEPRRSAG